MMAAGIAVTTATGTEVPVAGETAVVVVATSLAG
jgi:hypothetical protein